jgi:hypothetical protein
MSAFAIPNTIPEPNEYNQELTLDELRVLEPGTILKCALRGNESGQPSYIVFNGMVDNTNRVRVAGEFSRNMWVMYHIENHIMSFNSFRFFKKEMYTQSGGKRRRRISKKRRSCNKRSCKKRRTNRRK